MIRAIGLVHFHPKGKTEGILSQKLDSFCDNINMKTPVKFTFTVNIKNALGGEQVHFKTKRLRPTGIPHATLEDAKIVERDNRSGNITGSNSTTIIAAAGVAVV